MDALNQAIAQISDVLWNSVLLFLLGIRSSKAIDFNS